MVAIVKHDHTLTYYKKLLCNSTYSRYSVFCVIEPFRSILHVIHVKGPRIVIIVMSLHSNGRQSFTRWSKVNLNERCPNVAAGEGITVTQSGIVT